MIIQVTCTCRKWLFQITCTSSTKSRLLFYPIASLVVAVWIYLQRRRCRYIDSRQLVNFTYFSLHILFWILYCTSCISVFEFLNKYSVYRCNLNIWQLCKLPAAAVQSPQIIMVTVTAYQAHIIKVKLIKEVSLDNLHSYNVVNSMKTLLWAQYAMQQSYQKRKQSCSQCNVLRTTASCL